MSKWYERLTEVRSANGLSQQELADKLNVHLTSINRYEKGRGAEALPNKFKIKLLQVFTKDEVEYIEYGDIKFNDNRRIGNVDSHAYINQGNDQNITHKQLEKKEELLLELYRNSDSDGKKQILKVAFEVGDLS